MLKDSYMDTKETKKIERLVTAIYMLTSFFDDKEPMKWSLRELGNGLLSAKNSSQHVASIMSMLTVAKHTGLISDMNFDIVHKEFANLLPSLPELRAVLQNDETSEISSERKADLPATPPASSLYISSSVASKPQELLPEVKDKIVSEESAVSPLYPEEREDRNKKALKDFGVVAVKKNSRQSIIINLLKRKKEIMIKDVSPLIDGVSEKTIQRELLAMVQAGILNKTGEKRWSRYTLAD
jgi:hypothetical protein